MVEQKIGPTHKRARKKCIKIDSCDSLFRKDKRRECVAFVVRARAENEKTK
jgi:hypothetical protein